MSNHNVNRITAGLLLAIGLSIPAGQSLAQQRAATLEQLLEQTRTARAQEEAQHRQREQQFIQDRDRRAQMLRAAQQEKQRQETRSQQLTARFDANEKKLTELQAELDQKAGTLGEMFGVVRQVAGDTASVLHNSMVSAQYLEREEFTHRLSQTRALPSIDQLERLWFEMQREMTETGRVAAFDARVIAPDGTESSRKVVRVGPFTAMSGGAFLNYLPESRKFTELSRQPQSRYGKQAATLEGATGRGGYTGAVVDPTRGSLLAVLVQRPGLVETIEYGGLVGYVIIALAAIGFIIAAMRFQALSAAGSAVARQKKSVDQPSDDNALGRVLKVYHDDPGVDNETLQLRLDEAVLREVPALERGLSSLKILAAVGPLLGLLGTVTGMIITFQQITLFGTGDPKLMAGGISQALVTTVMGLIMAIPLVLLHAFLNTRSKNLVQMLEEESAGIIAEHAEKSRAG
jgi:biopolymer transport protein ExbB